MQATALPESVETPHVARATVLVIDDDEWCRSLVRVLLSQAAYQVLEASSGLEGLRLLASTSVDLVITDIIMPEHEGIETILRVRNTHPGLKILAVSGVDARHEYLLLATRMGADASLDKALMSSCLVSSVQALLQSS